MKKFNQLWSIEGTAIESMFLQIFKLCFFLILLFSKTPKNYLYLSKTQELLNYEYVANGFKELQPLFTIFFSLNFENITFWFISKCKQGIWRDYVWSFLEVLHASLFKLQLIHKSQILQTFTQRFDIYVNEHLNL